MPEADIEFGDIREISFNNLNYAVSVKSSHSKDTLEKLKQIALEILEEIKEK